MRYSGIRLFNGNASEIELVYDSNDGVFKGSLHLKEVSTGLYETATIFMLEEAYNQYGAPIIVKPIGSNVGSQFKAEFINAKNTSRDINLITTNLVDDEFIVSNVDSLLLQTINIFFFIWPPYSRHISLVFICKWSYLLTFLMMILIGLCTMIMLDLFQQKQVHLPLQMGLSLTLVIPKLSYRHLLLLPRLSGWLI